MVPKSKNVKVNIRIDDNGIKTNLKNNQTLFFTKKSFFYTILGFNQSHSREVDDIEDFIQLIPRSYERR